MVGRVSAIKGVVHVFSFKKKIWHWDWVLIYYTIMSLYIILLLRILFWLQINWKCWPWQQQHPLNNFIIQLYISIYTFFNILKPLTSGREIWVEERVKPDTVCNVMLINIYFAMFCMPWPTMLTWRFQISSFSCHMEQVYIEFC